MKRKNIRFTPDANTIVWFCKGHDEFRPDHVGLAISEAYGGAGFVVVQDYELTEGEEITVKTGEMPSLRSEVRWVKGLGDGIFQVGIKYIE